jgi:hypothetical protein
MASPVSVKRFGISAVAERGISCPSWAMNHYPYIGFP